MPRRIALAVAAAGLAASAAPVLAQSNCERAMMPEGYVSTSDFDEIAYNAAMEPALTAYREEGEAVADGKLAEMLEHWRESAGPASVEFAATLYQQGRVDLLQDRDTQAIDHFDQALRILSTNTDAPPDYLVLVLQDRASANRGIRNLRAAERDAREAVAMARSAYPITDRALVNSLQVLAGTLIDMHRKAEAASYYRDALSCALDSKELTPIFAAGIVSDMVADMTMEDGRAETSIALIDEAIARLRSWEGDGMVQEARLLAAKATALSQTGQEAAAAESQKAAVDAMVEIQQRPSGSEASFKINEAIYRHNLARSLGKLGQHSAAREQLLAMSSIMDDTLPDNHPVHVFTDRQRALNLIAIGETDAGEQLLEERYAVFKSLVPPTELRLIAWQADLGKRALEDGRAEDALSYYRLAAEGIEQRIAARQIDAVVAEQEWSSQRDVYVGLVHASAMAANAK